MAEEKQSVDEMFQNLDAVIKELDGEDVALEKAFSLYEKGVHLAGQLQKEIDLTEKKVLKLTKDGEESVFQ
jgi:exodeoxyribonuclease VII small subunit